MNRRRFILNLVTVLALSAALQVAAFLVMVRHDMELAREAAKARLSAIDASLIDSIKRGDHLRAQQLLNALVEGPAEGAALRPASEAGPAIRVGSAWPRGHERTPLVRHEVRDRAGALLGIVTVTCRARAVAAATLSRTAPMIVVLMAMIVAVVVLAQLPYLFHSRRMVKLLRTLATYDGEPAFREELDRMGRSSGDEGIRRLVSTICRLIDRQKGAAAKERETKVMCAIGEISSQVAHDMRSPLSVLKAFVQHQAAGLARQGDDDELYRAAAGRSVEKLGRMADELLDYARASRIDSSAVELRRYFEDRVLPEVKRAASKRRVKLLLDLPVNAQARIDGAKMERAVVNILNNAIQSIDHDDGEIRVLANAERGELSIGVADNGKGIPSENLGRIFERFGSFGKEGGTGLGLSYCKQVVDAHGGTIEVKSEEGKGTQVSIRIPNCIVD